MYFVFFFFNDTATTEIYTLSLHDALPISDHSRRARPGALDRRTRPIDRRNGRSDRIRTCDPQTPSLMRYQAGGLDRKSTRLNSSHQIISYAVFCLKKKINKCDTPNLQRTY